jgi:serine/threonine protein kinase
MDCVPFGRKYELGAKVGQGSFGTVRLARHKETGHECVVKIERADAKHPQLYYEKRVYDRLRGKRGFPQVMHYSSDKKHNYLVMQKLGMDLEKIRLGSPGQRVDVPTMAAIGIRGMKRLKAFHGAGFVHRDVKPQNLLLGPSASGPTDELYLVDFGLSKRFVTASGRHVAASGGRKKMTGTPRFASVNMHNGWAPSRRDDVEGLLYTLVYLYNGHLPWQNLPAKDKNDKLNVIGQKKKQVRVTTLCAGLPAGVGRILRHVRALKFNERPRYATYINILSKCL